LQRHYKINIPRNFYLACLAFTCFFYQVKAQNFDVKMLKSITSNRNYNYQNFHTTISFSVYPALLVSPTVFLSKGLIKKDTTALKTGLTLGTGIAINTAITIGLKYTTSRNRPYIDHPEILPIETENTPSFPSGHTSSAFNLATTFTLIYPKWYVAVPSYLWASGVAYSRMYIGVHYPSDVLFGALIGSGTAWLNYYLTKKYLKLYSYKRLYK
jgi:membrane-associated phospholipid phosphatase